MSDARKPGAKGHAAAPVSPRKKAPRAHRRIRVFFRQIALWLDGWGLRGYPQDMHDWGSKVEQLRRLKTTLRRGH